MSGTADPTHVYWDLENRKGLWARGEAMNSIDSKIPRRTQCGDHVHDCPQLAEQMDSLHEENARLRAALEEIRGLTKCASDVVIIRLSSIAAQALHPDWRNGGLAPEVSHG